MSDPRGLCLECGGSQWITWIDSDDQIHSGSCDRCTNGLEPRPVSAKAMTKQEYDALIQKCLAAMEKQMGKEWKRRKKE